ncbi:hypothetical protein [Streptomyces sp. NPDC090798]|uniref:hypothetical protein n=1 Tax=Streptomyces sp. NPDC090798 TaxID=3365968 RepID=UPI0037F174F5
MQEQFYGVCAVAERVADQVRDDHVEAARVDPAGRHRGVGRLQLVAMSNSATACVATQSPSPSTHTREEDPMRFFT